MELMRRMTKTLWVIVNTVIMESGLGVLKGLIGVYKIWAYGSAVVKKCRYWPS